MKKTTLAMMLLISCTAFFSCKKDNDEPAATIVGYWKGKYGAPTDYPSTGYAFVFRSNGTVRVFNTADTTTALKAEGTYTVTNSVVATTYTYITGGSKYSTTATIDPKFTFMEGTFGSGVNTSGGGRFFINKQ